MKTIYVKRFQIFNILLLLAEITSVICIQETAADNDWGRSFTYEKGREKGAVQE